MEGVAMLTSEGGGLMGCIGPVIAELGQCDQLEGPSMHYYRSRFNDIPSES